MDWYECNHNERCYYWQNSIIGAGAIVTKDIPANVIAAGIPCKVIKARL